jgi:hypothetical protein
MFTKRAVDWKEIGDTLLTPEVLGAIIGGAGTPLATYLVRRKKEMPTLQRIAELLGAAVLGAGAGAGVGYGGKKLGPKALEKGKELWARVRGSAAEEEGAAPPEGAAASTGETAAPVRPGKVSEEEARSLLASLISALGLPERTGGATARTMAKIIKEPKSLISGLRSTAELGPKIDELIKKSL